MVDDYEVRGDQPVEDAAEVVETPAVQPSASSVLEVKGDPANPGKTVVLNRWPTREEKTDELRQRMREARGG